MTLKKKRRVTSNGWINRLMRVFKARPFKNKRVADLINACPGSVKITAFTADFNKIEYGSCGMIEGHIDAGKTITLTLEICL